MPKLPLEYCEYFAQGGEVEGSLKVEPGYFQLWPPAKIAEFNAAYEVGDYAPGFLGFGSSGGGEMYAFDENHRVFMIPFIGMEPEMAILVAESWPDFVGLMEKTS